MKQKTKLMNRVYQKLVFNEKEIFFLIEIRDSLLPKLISGKMKVSAEVKI